MKKQDSILHTRKWKGQGTYTLESFVQLHRNAYISMKAASAHVNHQLPNEHTRVTHLLEAIENDDAALLAAIASVEADVGTSTAGVPGKREDFELAAAHLLPKDPVAKKRVAQKRPVAELSDVSAAPGEKEQKVGIGVTGVHYRYHTSAEYDALPPDQKQDLAQWRIKNPTAVEEQKKKKFKKTRTRTKGRKGVNIASAVKTAFEDEKKKVSEESNSREETKKYIMSLFETSDGTTASVSATAVKDTTAAAVTLSSILKKAKK